MKRLVLLCLVFTFLFSLAACDDSNTIEVEATITEKVIRNGQHYFNLSYELEGFHAPLTAQEAVSKRVFDRYDVGDTYLFKRPAPNPTN
ncbi:MAG: hypothetical protein EA374_07930 [Acholeplasmatales bacterium]|nr:MAG: hypothetical protein EA374_07930 [Acholeplasmatales bacterium]